MLGHYYLAINITMISSASSYSTISATIADVETRLWKRVATANLRKMVPVYAANLTTKLAEVCNEVCELEGDRRGQNKFPTEEHGNLKESMLTGSVPNRVFSYVRKNSHSSKNSFRSQLRNQSTRQFFGMNTSSLHKKQDLSQTKSTKIKTKQGFLESKFHIIAHHEIMEVNPTADLLREKKIFFQIKEQENERLLAMKMKSKKDREADLRKKLKDLIKVGFNYSGEVQENGNIMARALSPGVIITSDFAPEENPPKKPEKKKLVAEKIKTQSRSQQEMGMREKREKAEQESINQINKHLQTIDSQSTTRLFGNTLDQPEKICQGVSIKQVGTSLKRSKPLIRKGKMQTLSQFKTQTSFKRFRSFENSTDCLVKNLKQRTLPSEMVYQPVVEVKKGVSSTSGVNNMEEQETFFQKRRGQEKEISVIRDKRPRITVCNHSLLLSVLREN